MNSFLQSILDLPLDAKTKGIPLAEGTVRLGDVGGRGWNVLKGDMMFPLLTLREAAMHDNLRLMRGFAERNGAVLAPHGKTMMCPQIYQDILGEGGAWGLTAATVQQAVVVAASGARRIVIANEVVGRANIEQLAELKRLYPAVRFYSLVDSPETVAMLERHGLPRLGAGGLPARSRSGFAPAFAEPASAGEGRSAEAGRFHVLLEVGHVGGRTGARTVERAMAVVEAVRQSRGALQLSGVECFEGTIAKASVDETVAAIDSFLDFAVEVFTRARAAGAFEGCDEVLLSAGGSAYFDRVAARFGRARQAPNERVVLRGGCYVTFDHGAYLQKLREIDARGGLEGASGHIRASTAFKGALELWAMVESRPEPGLAIMTMGVRDLPHDSGFPVPLRQYRDGALSASLFEREPRFRILRSNDQHCYLEVPDGADVRVGDVFAFGVSHPCTAFD
ncbi:MAG: hypothetical protein ACREGL_06985, partial [Alphaproteobacteria bacterium]